jgi:hypothetical protein
MVQLSKLPAFQFYPGDWRKDPGVQSLDYHDRGVWFEMLTLMHESEQRGKLILNGKPMSIDCLARVLGIDPLRANATVDTLLSCGVASRDEQGVIYNRRMVRDEYAREFSSQQGKKGGNPSLVENYNQPGFLYAMQRSSDGKVKIGISQNPTKRLYKVRYTLKTSVEMLAVRHVQDMGKSEAEQHQKYAHRKDGEWFALTEEELFTLISTLKGNDKGKPTPSSSSSVSTTTSKNKDNGNGNGSSQPDTCDTRILSETVGIFGMREQADMNRLLAVHMKESGRNVNQAIEAMTGRWEEYQGRAPSLEWQYGSSYKFFMSGNWDKPELWPRKNGKNSEAEARWAEYQAMKGQDETE